VSVLLGDGDGTFRTQLTYDVGVAAVGVVVADVNGDRRPDLVVVNKFGRPVAPGSPLSPGDLSALLGNGDGTFPPEQVFTAAPAAASLTLADVNGDGTLDAVVRSAVPANPPPTGTVSVLLGDPDGTFQAPLSFAVGVAGPDAGVIVADLNGDGKPDLIVADADPGHSGPPPPGRSGGRGPRCHRGRTLPPATAHPPRPPPPRVAPGRAP